MKSERANCSDNWITTRTGVNLMWAAVWLREARKGASPAVNGVRFENFGAWAASLSTVFCQHA